MGIKLFLKRCSGSNGVLNIDKRCSLPSLSTFTALDDETVQIINIADNIKGGQFKPTSLIKSKEDLRAFQRFFGQKRDLRNTIINTMSDLSGLIAKNRFYKSIADKYYCKS